jgi:hypothetical protein
MIFGSVHATSGLPWRFTSPGNRSGLLSKKYFRRLKKNLCRSVPDPIGPNYLPCHLRVSDQSTRKCRPIRRCSLSMIRTGSSAMSLSIGTFTGYDSVLAMSRVGELLRLPLEEILLMPARTALFVSFRYRRFTCESWLRQRWAMDRTLLRRRCFLF